MPELPEVKTVVKHLNANVLWQTIDDVVINKSKLVKEISSEKFTQQIVNKQIEKIHNHGKFIVFHLSDNIVMLSHLRMEGKYRVIKNKQKTAIHDHIIFKLKNGDSLVYNDSRQFGTFHLRTNANYKLINPLAKIAQEPKNINIKDLYEKLQKKHIAIKTALLDQTIVAGLGNIYVNELLWQVKLNPQTKCHLISQQKLQEILRVATLILDKATKLGGSTIKSFVSFDKNEGQFQKFLQVHNKYNHPCSRCQSLIAKKSVNGRGTYFCPKCQS